MTVQLDYKAKQYIPAFDGWRGVGIIMVLIAHCFPSSITRSFWVAMDLFFVMSGFLITGILLDSRSNKNYYVNYITRRVLRVFPVYYFVLAISFLVIPALFPYIMGRDYDYYMKHQAWFWLYGQNWLLSFTGFPKNHTMIHFWSLAVEEQFYIFWPFLIKFFNSRKLLKICIGLILFSFYFRIDLGSRLGLVQPYPYVATLSRMDAISIGAIVAILIRERKEWLEKYVNYFACVSAIFVVVGFLYYRSTNFMEVSPLYTFVDVFAGCILLYSMSQRKPWIIRLGDHPIFRFFGKYSYGIYIYHYIIFNLLMYNLAPNLGIRHRFISEFVIAALTIGLSVAVSLISYRYIEKPFLKLKKYFSYDKSKASSPRQAPEVDEVKIEKDVILN